MARRRWVIFLSGCKRKWCCATTVSLQDLSHLFTLNIKIYRLAQITSTLKKQQRNLTFHLRPTLFKWIICIRQGCFPPSSIFFGYSKGFFYCFFCYQECHKHLPISIFFGHAFCQDGTILSWQTNVTSRSKWNKQSPYGRTLFSFRQSRLWAINFFLFFYLPDVDDE